jgi:hypothetical protein
MAVPLRQYHQNGRHKLTLLQASGLERPAATRPGCGFNTVYVSKVDGHRTSAERARRQSASNASAGRGAVVRWVFGLTPFALLTALLNAKRVR